MSITAHSSLRQQGLENSLSSLRVMRETFFWSTHKIRDRKGEMGGGSIALCQPTFTFWTHYYSIRKELSLLSCESYPSIHIFRYLNYFLYDAYTT